MFPVNFDRYIEVFGGGGWVLFGRPPDCRCMEVYNDYNSNLANLFTCVKERTWAFLKELGFLPVNGRDEFAVIRRFLDKQEFDAPFLAEELKLAQVSLPVPDFEEIRAILMENAELKKVLQQMKKEMISLLSPQKKKLNNLSPASKQLTKKLLIIASHI